MARTSSVPKPWTQTSWWVLITAGAVTMFFMVAIVREVLRSATVRRQVARLHNELAQETQRQTALQDLIGYLSSPTFQEREARLKLGLKKSGERVIVIPPTEPGQTNAGQTRADGQAGGAGSIPGRWWQYFFGVHPPTSTS